MYEKEMGIAVLSDLPERFYNPISALDALGNENEHFLSSLLRVVLFHPYERFWETFPQLASESWKKRKKKMSCSAFVTNFSMSDKILSSTIMQSHSEV